MINYTVLHKRFFRPSIYRLDEPLVFHSEVYEEFEGFEYTHSVDGVLEMNPGLIWDGATGGVDTDSFMRASLIHDIYCRAIYDRGSGENKISVKYQEYADELLRDIAIEDGMSKLRANNVYFWVRGFQKRSRARQLKQGKIYY